jgi:nitrite reductase/ring-hydroxylating ferredoxin subunit/uncharacterized membrane protein
MMLKAFLQGKPFGHPLHTALVHFPIALWVLSLLFDAAGLIDPGANWLPRASLYTMLGGIGMALLAAIPGLVDWSAIRADHPAKKPATLHLILNVSAVGMYAVNAALRAGALQSGVTPTLSLLLSAIAILLISISGYLGGRLIYEDGIAVGRHRRQRDTPTRTLRVARGPSHQFVPVADTNTLKEGETLRVQINGNVMAIVRLNDQFFAFQEFCTHRYGPLSEGQFDAKGCQVVCPWHGSCFDVRTGKVTQGPAKVDLKTYEIEVRDNKIRVRLPHSEHEHAGQYEKVIV